RVRAPGAGAAVEVDSRIEWHTVDGAAGGAVGEGVQTRNASIRIEKAELRGLTEANLARVVRGPGGELISLSRQRSEQRELAGQPIVVLRRVTAAQQPVAFFRRLIVEQHVGDASPERERRVRGAFAGDGKPGKACGRERGPLRGIGLIDRLVERVVVDVSVQ